jgi:hypothetical protein
MNNTSIIQSEYFEQNSNLDINNKNNNIIDFINEDQIILKNEDLLENSSTNNINLLMTIHDFNILPEDNNNNDTIKNISIISQYQPSEKKIKNNNGSIKELGQGKYIYLYINIK